MYLYYFQSDDAIINGFVAKSKAFLNDTNLTVEHSNGYDVFSMQTKKKIYKIYVKCIHSFSEETYQQISENFFIGTQDEQLYTAAFNAAKLSVGMKDDCYAPLSNYVDIYMKQKTVTYFLFALYELFAAIYGDVDEELMEQIAADHIKLFMKRGEKHPYKNEGNAGARKQVIEMQKYIEEKNFSLN